MWPAVSPPDQLAIYNALRSKVWNFHSIAGRFSSEGGLRCTSSGRCCSGGRHTHNHIWSRAASKDSSGGKTGLCFCTSSGSCGNSRISKFQTSEHGVDTRGVASRGLGNGAGFSMSVLWVQEFSTKTTPALTCVAPLAWSILHVDHKVVRRQDTPCTNVQEKKPVVRDVRVAQIFNSCNVLPRSLGLQGVF